VKGGLALVFIVSVWLAVSCSSVVAAKEETTFSVRVHDCSLDPIENVEVFVIGAKDSGRKLGTTDSSGWITIDARSVVSCSYIIFKAEGYSSGALECDANLRRGMMVALGPFSLE